MKARHLAALAIVAAAGSWIASGHLLPHQKAEGRAALRTAEDASNKLFRVAVITTNVVPTAASSRSQVAPKQTDMSF